MVQKKTESKEMIRHVLVPEHIILSDKETKDLLESYNISVAELPKIKTNDPAIRHLDAKPGAVVKILRDSMSAGETVFYRTVVGE